MKLTIDIIQFDLSKFNVKNVHKYIDNGVMKYVAYKKRLLKNVKKKR